MRQQHSGSVSLLVICYNAHQVYVSKLPDSQSADDLKIA